MLPFIIWCEFWTDDGIRRRLQRSIICAGPGAAAREAGRDLDALEQTYGAGRCRGGSYGLRPGHDAPGRLPTYEGEVLR
jgi:hypothetical protein